MDERGQVDARRGDFGAVEIIIDAEAADARLGPGGEIGSVLRGEGRVTVGGPVGAHPREDRRAELDGRSAERLQVSQHADGMTLALQVAVGRPRRVGDGVIEAEDVVGAHRTLAIPALGLRGVIVLERVVDAEGNGEGVGVLLEEAAGVLGADFRSAWVVEVRVRIVRVALRFDRLAPDHREEQRLLFPELLVEGAIEPVREARGPAVADGEGPVFGEFIESAQLAPAEVRTEFIRAREAELIARTPVRAEFTGEGEEDAEVLFAETTDGDARGGRVVAEEEDGLADDRTTGGVAFFGQSLDAGGAGGRGLADIDRQGRAAHALGFITRLRTHAGHALAPIGEGTGGGEFIDLRLGRQDDGRPGAGVEKTARARQGGE